MTAPLQMSPARCTAPVWCIAGSCGLQQHDALRVLRCLTPSSDLQGKVVFQALSLQQGEISTPSEQREQSGSSEARQRPSTAALNGSREGNGVNQEANSGAFLSLAPKS